MMITPDTWSPPSGREAFSSPNPRDRMPTTVDREGPGGEPLAVIESGAILLHLEETGRPAVRRGMEAGR